VGTLGATARYSEGRMMFLISNQQCRSFCQIIEGAAEKENLKNEMRRNSHLSEVFPRTVAGISRTSCWSSLDLLSQAFTWNTDRSPVSMLRSSTLQQILHPGVLVLWIVRQRFIEIFCRLSIIRLTN